MKKLVIISLLFCGIQAARAQTAYVWHDGPIRYTVWLQPSLVAEFGESGDDVSAPSSVRSADPSAELHRAAGVVRIWRSNAPQRTGRGGQSRLSPVFTNEKQGGQLRALPGNVIVSFQENWGEADVRAFAARQGLNIVRRLPLSGSFYEFASDPGLASLELANRLHGLPGVKVSMPNWWTELQPR